MAPPRKISGKQLQILVEYLESNADMSKGSALTSSPKASQGKEEKWIILAKKLNGVKDGAKKTVQGWKRYWFTWRYRCSKRAENATKLKDKPGTDSYKFLPLTDIEVRVLQLKDKKGSPIAKVSSKKVKKNSKIESNIDLDLFSDSDDENVMDDNTADDNVMDDNSADDNVADDSFKETIITPTVDTEVSDIKTRAGTPPPQWAMDLENRRIAAEERMASALESIAKMMRSQEERRSMLEERIADALTSIAGSLQDISSTSQKKSNNHFKPQSDDESSMKDVIFL